MSSELLLMTLPLWLMLGASIQGVALLLGERPKGVLLAVTASLAVLAGAVTAAILYGSRWQAATQMASAGETILAGTNVSIAAAASLALTLLLLFLFAGQGDQRRPTATLIELLCGGGAVVAVVAGDLWLILGGISLAGWTAALRSIPAEAVSAESSEGSDSAAAGAGQAVIVGLVGDVLFAAGLLTLDAAGLPPALGALNHPEIYSALGRLEQAYWGLGAYLMLGGLLIRCALFPAAFWIKGIVHSPRDAAWMCGILLPVGGWSLVRTVPVWGPPVELQEFLIRVGVLGSLLVAIIAAVQPTAQRMCSYVAAAQLGLVWAAEGAASRHPSPATGFFILGALGLPLILLATTCGPPTESEQDGPPTRMAWLGLGLAAVWGSGLLGQEWLVNQLFESAFAAPAQPVVSPGLPPIFVAAVPVAHTLICFAIARASWLFAARADGAASTAGPSWSLRQAATGGLLVVAAAASAFWFLVPARTGLEIPLITPICMLIGILLARLVHQTSPERKGSLTEPLSGALQMCAREFYSETVLKGVFVKPLQATARLLQSVEQRVMERGMVRWATRLTGDIDSLSRELEEDSPGRAWKTMLVVVVVLLAAVALAQ